MVPKKRPKIVPNYVLGSKTWNQDNHVDIFISMQNVEIVLIEWKCRMWRNSGDRVEIQIVEESWKTFTDS